jgi:hypothetical protein
MPRGFFAHHGLSVDKARGWEIEDGGGVVGFRLPKERVGESEVPGSKAVKGGGRRKAAG